ncbi:hypothetical protein GLAREA_06276 [Glarea lozoyensis ATCC 20868]|uniref:Uncharacterized protein n=1 Tax=Glarea lozoyensis (strain ATCC 20868 / MF5171) TaxID=1116229 RepID=S3D831_GLAL2|nr:uncharacterized protein GLAREA_06276 [Glarea lozoyensis ATCC 20868]EPE33264.1 hypothetical protein GLAREA_06276 [Glarea lozoyensis ATCC 20868]
MAPDIDELARVRSQTDSDCVVACQRLTDRLYTNNPSRIDLTLCEGILRFRQLTVEANAQRSLAQHARAEYESLRGEAVTSQHLCQLLSAREAEVAKLKEDISELRDSLSASENKVAKSTEELSVIRQSISSSAAGVEKSTEEISLLLSSLASRDAEIAKLKNESSVLRKSILASEAENISLKAENAAIRSLLIARETEFASLREDVSGLCKSVSTDNKIVPKLGEVDSGLHESLSILREEVSGLRNLLSAGAGNVAKTRSIDSEHTELVSNLGEEEPGDEEPFEMKQDADSPGPSATVPTEFRPTFVKG